MLNLWENGDYSGNSITAPNKGAWPRIHNFPFLLLAYKYGRPPELSEHKEKHGNSGDK